VFLIIVDPIKCQPGNILFAVIRRPSIEQVRSESQALSHTAASAAKMG
jgi:hypothetical protein